MQQNITIRRLSPLVIDQIAAGEVVERPANVLKELVENAIDAGATQIEVALENGGINSLQISDDGFGMSPQDLSLCVERHATSKLTNLDDLEKLPSYGFRGEALSSIASVSEVNICSRRSNDALASQITVRFGEVSLSKPIASPVGTTVTVKNIFGKIPARQKFLRSGSTEFSHCAKHLKEISLTHPEIQFTLTHEGKLIFRYRQSNLTQRVWDCLKLPWKQNEGLELSEATADFSFEGFLSPTSQLSDRGEVILVVNSRVIRHRALSAALRNAYAETLGPHHVPSGVAFLKIRPDWVDVNVHPQKLEVRILKSEKFYPWILAVIRKAIAASRAIRTMDIPTAFPEQPRFFEPKPETRLETAIQEPRIESHQLKLEEKMGLSSQNVSGQNVPGSFTAVKEPGTFWPDTFWAEDRPIFPSRIKYLGQVKASYLVCEDEESIVLIDQHALHEKIVFEKLVGEFESQSTQTQAILIPLILEFPTDSLSYIREHQNELREIGFELRIMGEQEIALVCAPARIQENEIETVFREIVLQMQKELRSEKEGLRNVLRKTLATVACHSVVRANQTLSVSQVQPLLDGLDKLETGWTCPHGRPVLFRVPYPTLEKYFAR